MGRKLLLLLALCSCLAISEFAFADCNASFVCPFETISCSLVGAGTCSSGATDGGWVRCGSQTTYCPCLTQQCSIGPNCYSYCLATYPDGNWLPLCRHGCCECALGS